MSLFARTSFVAAATLGSRLLGFARDAGTAAVLGAGPLADALMAALSLPLLARRLLAEGAVNAALIPALGVARREKAPSARRLARGILVLLSLTLVALTGLGLVFMPHLIGLLAPGFALDGQRADLAVQCGRLALLYVPLAGVAAVHAAVANSAQRIVMPALAPVVANAVVLVVIAVLLLNGRMASPLAAQALAVSTLVAGLAQALLMRLAARGALDGPPPSARGVGDLAGGARVLRAAAPALLFAGLSQFRLLLAAAVVSAVPGAVAALNYAQRLVDLPLGLVGASAGAILVPLLVAGARAPEGGRGDPATGAALAALGLAVPAGLGLFVLAEPIVTVLYQRASFTAQDAILTASLLRMLALSLPAQGLERVLCAIAMSHGLERQVERVGLAGLVLCLLLAVALERWAGAPGAAAAVALSASLSAGALLVVLFRRALLHWTGAVLCQMRALVMAGAVMAIAVGGAQGAWSAPPAGTLQGLVRLALLVALGLAAFTGVWFAAGGRAAR